MIIRDNKYSIFVTFGLILAVLFSVRTCSEKSAIQDDLTASMLQVDGLLVDTVRLSNKAIRFENKSIKCEGEQAKAREYTSKVQAAIEAGEQKVSKAVASRTPQQQRVSAVKGLVKSGALPVARLPDTTYATYAEPIIADTQLVASVDRLTGWYEVYRDSTVSLIKSVAAKDAKIETLTTDRRECEDEVSDLRKLVRQPRRGKFWVWLTRFFGGKA